MRGLLRFDWDVVGGIIAAVLAIILHLLHVAEEGILLTIVLVLLAFLLLRSLRGEHRVETLAESVAAVESSVRDIRAGITPPQVILIGPDKLRQECEAFIRHARGNIVWFNMCCLMFRRQEIFDMLIGPALRNPHVRSIQFILHEEERPGWETNLLSRLRESSAQGKVREVRWFRAAQAISFILAELGSEGQLEALISFWGEPFMAQRTEHQIPRYVLRVRGQSDLVPRLVELARQHQIGN